MHSILVPTDFSACASNAVEAAALLAERFQAELHLLHCLQHAPADWHPGAASGNADHEQDYANALTLLEATAAKHPQLQTSLTVKAGRLDAAIPALAAAKGVDLVVIGSHGSSGFNELFIGSNAQKVLRQVHCPVLVVKQPLKTLQFDKVVYASSFTLDEKEAFLRFKRWVSPFVPEIHLVAVHTPSLFNPPMVVELETLQHFEALCAPLACQTHLLPAMSVEEGVRHLANETGAQLIAMSNHLRHPLKRMLAGSALEALVNHASVPVLSVDYEE